METGTWRLAYDIGELVGSVAREYVSLDSPVIPKITLAGTGIHWKNNTTEQGKMLALQREILNVARNGTVFSVVDVFNDALFDEWRDAFGNPSSKFVDTVADLLSAGVNAIDLKHKDPL